MKFFFDKKLLDYLSLELKAYEKKEILNSILNNDNIWSNINGKIILNNQIISIIKNKYPNPDNKVMPPLTNNLENSMPPKSFQILFNTPGYWQGQLNKGFEIDDLYKIINSCVIDSFDKYSNLDKGIKVMNLEI